MANNMTMSAVGLEMLKHFEGCSLKAYQDSVHVWTIGWGAIVMPSGDRVKQGDVITQAEADALLIKQVDSEGAHYVRAWAGPLVTNQAQFDALTDFCYNRGAGRLKQLIGESKTPAECAENMLQFDWAGNPQNHLPGLTRRRKAEREMYLGGSWEKFKA